MILPYVIFGYNTSIQESTHFSPFEILYGGRKSKLPQQIDLNQHKILIDEMIKKAQIMKKQARENLLKSQQTQKKYHDEKHNDIEFEENDLVMVKNPSSQKLESKYSGPYKILQKLSKLNYKIALPSGSRMDDVIHISRLKKVNKQIDPALPYQTSQSDREDEHFEIESILDKKFMISNDGKRRLYYLIKWKGYDETSWEPKTELNNAKEMVKYFERGRNKKKS